MTRFGPVLVSVVTHDEEPFLERCLVSVLAQSVPVRVRIFDNCSRDRTCEIAVRFPVRLTRSERNLGFSFGHNRNLEGDESETVLVLNADIVLKDGFLERLLGALDEVPGAGMAGGKLLRMGEDGGPLVHGGCMVLDSTGMYFTPAQRHFDRGSQEKDRGQYERRQLMFGITGAAMLCRRGMLEDLKVNGEVFDEDFFIYREDADLAWRAQLRGWKAVYEPGAQALHRRLVLPSRRREVSTLINYHSVKNRYLMRIKNMDAAVRRRCIPYMWLRDLFILTYVPLMERASLPAFSEIRRLRGKFEAKREQVQGGRRVGPDSLARWFSFRPVSEECVCQ